MASENREKLLTVSIAAYNVASYLPQALDSCIVPDIMDELEVLIVNDGSTDETPQIAAAYEERYPQTFRLIDKENGGYGSTVNRSMGEAKGRYFRLLDGDDWFSKEGLLALVTELRTATEDAVVTPMYRVKDGSDDYELAADRWRSYYGQALPLGEIAADFPVGMWHLAVRSDCFRRDPFNLPEHTLYTDMLFVVQSLLRAKNVRFLTEPLYCYRIGRDGQSVSRESRIKNYPQMLRVFHELIEESAARWPSLSPAERGVVATRLRWYHYYAIKTFLLPEASPLYKNEMVQVDAFVKEALSDVYKLTGKQSRKVRVLRLTGYAAYGLFAGKEENWT